MEPEKEQELQEAVIREIKRRRKGPPGRVPSAGDNDAPVSLQERRVSDKASITEVLTQYKSLLTPWSKIMAKCLEGKEPKPFVRLRSGTDFIDGIQLVVAAGFTA